MIDSAYHQIGSTVFQHVVFGEFHAIGGGAGAFVGNHIPKNITWIQPEGIRNRDGVAHPRLWAIGGHHDNGAELLHYLNERSDTVRGNSIVVGH